MSVRRIVVIAAAACMMSATNRSLAQAPPANRDSEQRLKALEDKMDRVLKLLEDRTAAFPKTPISDKQVALIAEARDALTVRYDSAQKAYTEFVAKSPIARFPKRDATGDVAIQRLAKDESVLQDLQQRQTEVTVRAGKVKSVGDDEKEARALLVLLQRRGVDVEMLRRAAAPRRDEGISALELIRLYGLSLQQEADELKQLVAAAEDRISLERKVIRDYAIYDVMEDQLRKDRDQSLKMLDAIAAQLSKIEVLRQQQPPK